MNSFTFDFLGYTESELNKAFKFWNENKTESDGYDRPDYIVLQYYNELLNRQNRYSDDSDIFDIARGFDAHKQRSKIGGLMNREDCKAIKNLAYRDGWNSSNIVVYDDPDLDFVYDWFYGVGFHSNPHHEHPIFYEFHTKAHA
jgi:hypothetical protein